MYEKKQYDIQTTAESLHWMSFNLKGIVKSLGILEKILEDMMHIMNRSLLKEEGGHNPPYQKDKQDEIPF